MKWNLSNAEWFVKMLGQSILYLSAYGLLVVAVQNILLYFSVPFLYWLQNQEFEGQKSFVEEISQYLQWVFVGFLGMLLVGFIVAFFFRKFQKWAWYGMNVVIGVGILIVVTGTAFFYHVVPDVQLTIIEDRLSMIKALISMLSFALIFSGLYIIKNLNQGTVKQLFEVKP